MDSRFYIIVYRSLQLRGFKIILPFFQVPLYFHFYTWSIWIYSSEAFTYYFRINNIMALDVSGMPSANISLALTLFQVLHVYSFFNPHNRPELVLWLSSFCRWGSWGRCYFFFFARSNLFPKSYSPFLFLDFYWWVSQRH